MKKKLKEELRKLCTDIIVHNEKESIAEQYESARALYEKLAVLKFIEEKLSDIEIDVSKNVIAERFEKMANAVLNENTGVPESNPHQEDIITPGIDTIKDMVSEMPTAPEGDSVLEDFLNTPNYLKNDKDLFTPSEESGVKNEGAPKSLNDKLSTKEIKIDLNNRLAFVKHLFNGSTEDYTRIISQLKTIDTHERSVAFITNMVKPDYNNWENKEEFEERFMDLIERSFN